MTAKVATPLVSPAAKPLLPAPKPVVKPAAKAVDDLASDLEAIRLMEADFAKQKAASQKTEVKINDETVRQAENQSPDALKRQAAARQAAEDLKKEAAKKAARQKPLILKTTHHCFSPHPTALSVKYIITLGLVLALNERTTAPTQSGHKSRSRR